MTTGCLTEWSVFRFSESATPSRAHGLRSQGYSKTKIRAISKLISLKTGVVKHGTLEPQAPGTPRKG